MPASAKPVGAKPVSRSIADAHYMLQARWPMIVKKFRECTGNDLVLTCSYRTVEEQKRLYAQGRTTKGPIVTWVDGETKKSKHNEFPSKAIDVAVIAGGKVVWDPKCYVPLGIICKDLALTWGGIWKVRDLPHIEVP